jgi:hypothetical protein
MRFQALQTTSQRRLMSQNAQQYAQNDGQRTEAAGHQQEARGWNEQMQGFLGKPAVGAAIAGAVVAAVIFNIPEALLGAAAGVAVHAIRKRRSSTTAKSGPTD